MSTKTWVFIIIDLLVTALVIKVVFKEYKLFFKALKAPNLVTWIAAGLKREDYDINKDRKLTVIWIVIGLLIVIEKFLL